MITSNASPHVPALFKRPAAAPCAQVPNCGVVELLLPLPPAAAAPDDAEPEGEPGPRRWRRLHPEPSDWTVAVPARPGSDDDDGGC